MASEHDLKLALKIKAIVDGLAEISGLANEVEGLGESSDTARATAALLSRELDELAAQQRLIDQFAAFKRELNETSQQLDESRQRTAQLAREIKSAETPSKSLSREFARAREVTRGLAEQEQRQTLALQKLRAELRAGGIDSNKLAQAQGNIRKAMSETEGRVAALRQRLTETRDTARAGMPDPTGALRDGLKQTERQARSTGDSLDKTKRSGLDLANTLRFVAAGAVTRAFFQAGASAESLQKAFELLTGSGEAAAGELQFIREEAGRLGVDLPIAADSFLQLSAAAKGTTLEGAQTRAVWSAVAEAMGRLGKSGADTQGAFLAVSQMMSKGTVSAEELRGQLGERLPGAFQVAARAMGVTTAELGKLLQNGQITADEFLPKFAAELNKTFGAGAVDTFNANLARLRNSINQTFVTLSQTGVLKAVSEAISGVGSAVNFLAVGFVGLGKYIGAAGASASIFFDSVKNADFSSFGDKVKFVFGQARQDIQEIADKTFATDQNLREVSKSANEAGEKLDEAAKKPAQGFDALDKQLRDAVLELEKAAAGGEALKKVFDEIGGQGIIDQGNFSELDAVLTRLRDKAQQTDVALRDGLAATLTEISATQLAEFQQRAEIAFVSGELSAQSFATVVDATLAAAFKRLGITSQSELQKTADSAREAFDIVRASGKAAPEDIEKAFASYARAAIAANNGVASSLLISQPAALGLSNSFKTAGEEARAAGDKASGAMDKITESTNASARAVDNLAARLARAGTAEARQLGDELVNAFARGLVSAAEFEKMMALIQRRLTDLHAAGEGISAALAKPIIAAREEFAKFGDQAVADFNRIVEQSAISGESVWKFWTRLAEATEMLRRKYEEIEAQEKRTAEAQQRRAEAAQRAADKVIDQLTNTESLSQTLIDSARRSADAMRNLNASTLDRLNRSIAEAERRLDAIQDKARGAADSLRDELLRLQGDESAIENRDFQRRLKELEALRAEAKAAGDSAALKDAKEAIDLLKQAHELRMANIAAEAEARKRSDEEAAAREAQRAIDDARASSTGAPSSPGAARGSQPVAGEALPSRVVRVEFATPAGLAHGDFPEADAARLIDLLDRQRGLA